MLIQDWAWNHCRITRMKFLKQSQIKRKYCIRDHIHFMPGNNMWEVMPMFEIAWCRRTPAWRRINVNALCSVSDTNISHLTQLKLYHAVPIPHLDPRLQSNNIDTIKYVRGPLTAKRGLTMCEVDVGVNWVGVESPITPTLSSQCVPARKWHQNQTV